ncbi:hypothetical protein Tco_0481802 [Tanacetum coccineum]
MFLFKLGLEVEPRDQYQLKSVSFDLEPVVSFTNKGKSSRYENISVKYKEIDCMKNHFSPPMKAKRLGANLIAFYMISFVGNVTWIHQLEGSLTRFSPEIHLGTPYCTLKISSLACEADGPYRAGMA